MARQTSTVFVKTCDTVKEVQAKIQARDGTPRDLQRLIVRGRQMDDERTGRIMESRATRWFTQAEGTEEL